MTFFKVLCGLHNVFFFPLQGRHLDVFNAVPGLEVTVGNNPCIVTNISATTILCKPPAAPEILSPAGHAVVMVRISFPLKYQHFLLSRRTECQTLDSSLLEAK